MGHHYACEEGSDRKASGYRRKAAFTLPNIHDRVDELVLFLGSSSATVTVSNENRSQVEFDSSVNGKDDEF
ncbi:hypothetical protein KIN20_005702 [Parelaphostrongylus tenuis]|uniref:Uncharacterized protein n=1 Tax=Parelaphostrongylus tenuis TaxID=148309 RepID=A0AAD5QKE0_PARTN|nr:hypothetical protein KIN20_005702 [Parelaphostrongylus tenuis]